MKKITSILLILVLFACWACTSDLREDGWGNDVLSVRLNLPAANVRTYATPGLTGESNIGNVYLLFYAQGSGTDVTPDAFYSETGLSNNDSWSKEMLISTLGLTPGTVYDVYALANLSIPEASRPTAATTLEQLYAMTETQFARNIDDPQISLYGKHTYTGGDASLRIDLQRVVAKIDLQVLLSDALNGWTVTGVRMENERMTTAFVPGQPSISAERTSGDMIPVLNETNRFRYYMYENAAGDESDMLRIRIHLADPNEQPTYIVGLLNDAGSGEIKRNCIYNATMTINSPEPEVTNVMLNTYLWDEQVNIVAEGVPVAPPSNSYILKPGRTVYVPVSQANRHDASAIGAQDDLEVGLVWSEVTGIDPDGVIKGISLIGNGKEAIIEVVAGSSPGNALVAVKKAGNIVWSWHIWVTYYDPVATGLTYYGGFGAVYGEGTLMGCNLGATGNSPTNTIASMGLFYQWGRKDPFPYKPATPLSDGSVSTTLFDAGGMRTSLTMLDEQVSLNEAIQNPNVMYMRNDWLTPAVVDLWTSTATPKNIYDPCPYGWRVPDQNEVVKMWSLFTSLGSTGISTSGGYYLPWVGSIGLDETYTASGELHMSESNMGSTTSVLLINTKTAFYNSGDRGPARAIRCVKYNGEV